MNHSTTNQLKLPLGDKVNFQRSEEPPLKRQKLERKKNGSPPWKKALADGPSTFTQEGRRRSGRVNPVPLELQAPSDKRPTRAPSVPNSNHDQKRLRGGRNKKSTIRSYQTTNALAKEPKFLSSNSTSSSIITKKVAPPKQAFRKYFPNQKERRPLSPDGSLDSGHGLSPEDITRPTTSVKDEEVVDKNQPSRAKIRLHFKSPSLPVIHPGLVLLRPRQYSGLREYLKNAASKHINEGGLLHPDYPSDYPHGSALDDAHIILRAEKEVSSGGILAPERCWISNRFGSSQSIPQQYSHLDHLCKAAIGLKRLMQIEHKNHRIQAKRLAEACRDKWILRQPKTADQIEAEITFTSRVKYKNLIKVLQITWDNVKAEVNRLRFLEWEAEEQVRIRKALSEAVDISQRKLQQRRAYLDSSSSCDEDAAEIVNDEITIELDSDNEEINIFSEHPAVSETQSISGVLDDENMTVEQPRDKCSLQPIISPKSTYQGSKFSVDTQSSVAAEKKSKSESRTSYDESDESIDMEDDVSSSDEAQYRDTDEDEDDVDTEETGILGFFTHACSDSVNINERKESPTKPTLEDLETPEHNVSNSLSEDKYGIHFNAQFQNRISADRSREDHQNEMNNDIIHLSGFKNEQEKSSHSSKQNSPSTMPSTIDHSKPFASCEAKNQTLQQELMSSPKPQQYDYSDPSSNVNHIKTEIPFLLRGTLREYQHFGLDWLASLYANNTNGILADEMGLGKTIQTISLLAHLACVHEEWGPHLVIVPTSVILNWEMEFKKWCPGLKVMTYYGTIDERKKKRIGWKNKDMWNVCITSYQLIIRDQQVFKRRRWHYMILDEAHNIKNFNSQRWQTMLTFNTRARLLLTGTPLQNNLTELWSLLYFLMPSDGKNKGMTEFADLKEFQDWFKKPSDQILEHGRERIDHESRCIIRKLHKILRPYLLRRMKTDVEKQMPAKYEHIEYCRLSKRQRELYDGFLSRNDTKETMASGNYLSIINCLMQLRKVCNHPDLFIDRPILTSFSMEESVVTDYGLKELAIRRNLLNEHPMTKASLEFLNLIPTRFEKLSSAACSRTATLSYQRTLMDLRETQGFQAKNFLASYDPSTVKSNLAYLESTSRWDRFEELKHCVYINALRRQQKPIYGSHLVEFLTLDLGSYHPRPKSRKLIIEWLENDSHTVRNMLVPLSNRAEILKSTLQKFACTTPAVVVKNMSSLLFTPQLFDSILDNSNTSDPDPFHEARMRLSIQFPDKRLLQFDCGKLQTLDKLLRKLQAGGHRALIFTQMTKVLDILEKFLNIHGHKYLRLDGSTKIEQRQILTDRFNNDSRILAFILSSRSGGLGINLTGADTVIFYDLDWNPAMDKQCQDRCHRIGQTRDVHIYRLISEYTIETNILRKANQKRILDDIVIQEGDFTTDYFNKVLEKNATDESTALLDGDAATNAVVDRVLGRHGNKEVQRVFAQAEDHEDAVAASLAEQEVAQTNAADFNEAFVDTSTTTGGHKCAQSISLVDNEVDENAAIEIDESINELNAWGKPLRPVDSYMLKFMEKQLKDTHMNFPKEKHKGKKGKDSRSHRVRLKD
ncbi:Bgt-5281 [Blumeria graminis f. sp. tritici]|uniref:DNA helicase n=2 Tax=Blumeria graminis f. sp. tritici TaxID=62690 RepID=A0A061HIJ7_BLUGR|nr:Swi2-Snf2-related ATPase [Blumeria graminis f. sp. tritici 96224]VDB90923.1 Bgt-5281 [Blumeria graminis f. sp. tritici]